MSKLTVGIIGDGQLGMLLCEAAPALDLATVMLTSDQYCAAAQRADSCIEGAMDDASAIEALVDACDIITYEREDIPAPAVTVLRRAEQAGSVTCHPSLDVIELIQDKARQKTWLAENKLATLPFRIVDGSRQQLQQGAQELGFPLVQKAPRGGFDGRGVQVLKNADELTKVWPGTTVLEAFAGDFCEIAVLIARGADGACTHFGPVGMTFETEYSVLDTVFAPADISAEQESEAIDLAQRAIAAMNGVGVFGVEMFLLSDGRILINEISPRVHNAGHYTLEACHSSQFEQHLRAVTGMPLANAALKTPAAMRNLLCTPALKKEDKHRDAGCETVDETRVYWYGKSPARLMRKLGHITATAATREQALQRVNEQWNRIQDEANKA